jgi:hypothetical protein
MTILRASATADRLKLTEIGRLYKGGPKGTSARGYAGGDDYASHYLRFEPDVRFKLSPATSPEFKNLHDELKARWETLIARGSVQIRFPYQGVDANWSWSNKLIKVVGGTGRTFNECDGTTCTKWTESGKKGPEMVRGSRPCAAGPDDKNCPVGCKPHGMLKFYVPELHPGGVVLFPLKGPIDVGNIQSYLNSYAAFDLTAVPFSLFRREQVVEYLDGKGNSQSKINWGLHLEVDPTIAQLMLQGRAAAYERQLASGDIRLLSASAAPALEATVVAAPDYSASQQYMDFQNAITKATQNCDIDRVLSLVDAEKRSIGGGDFDLAGLRLVDRELTRAMDMINAAPPAAPEVPAWADALAAKREELGLSREDVKELASKATPQIVLDKKLTDKNLNRLFKLMEDAAAIDVTLDANIVVEGEEPGVEGEEPGNPF